MKLVLVQWNEPMKHLLYRLIYCDVRADLPWHTRFKLATVPAITENIFEVTIYVDILRKL